MKKVMSTTGVETNKTSSHQHSSRGSHQRGKARVEGKDDDDDEILDLPIPELVKCLFNPIMGGCLYKRDSFEQIMRKMALLVFTLGGCCALFPVIYSLIMFQREGYLVDLLTALSLGLMTVIFFFAYFSVRLHSKHISDNMATLCVAACTQAWCLVHLSGRLYDLRWIDMTIVCLSIITNSKGKGIVGLIYLALILQSIYNDSYREVSSFALELPTRDSAGLERLLFHLMCLFPGLALLVAIWFVSEEQKRQVRAANQSVVISRQIVEDLRKYNTEKVQDFISQALENDGDEVNRDLLQSFAAMVENLEKYRPFLPNYLFLTSSGEEHESECEDEDDEGTLHLMDEASSAERRHHRHKGGSRRRRTGTSSSQGSHTSSCGKRKYEHDADDDDEGSVASYGSSLSTVTAHHRNQGSVASSSVFSAPAGVGHAGVNASTSGGGVNSFRGIVSMGLIEVKTSQWFSSTPTRSSPSIFTSSLPKTSSTTTHSSCAATDRQLLSNFTDVVFEVAKSTKASVHSMLGDTIQLSWNATHRVAQPELKAAQMLLQIKTEVEQTFQHHGSRIEIAGAACSGVAEVHSVFSSKLKQFALFVDAPWLPALQKISQLAVTHRTILVDSNTKDPSSYNVTAQAVDCIRYKPRAAQEESTGEFSVNVAPGAKSLPYLRPLVAIDSEKMSLVETILSNSADRRSGSGESKGDTNTSTSDRFTLVHELTSLLHQNEHDEWMYQLQSLQNTSGRSPSEKPFGEQQGLARQEEEENLVTEESITHVLMLAIDGKFGEAVEEIEKLRDQKSFLGSRQERSGSVQQLFKSCESKLSTRNF